MMFYALKDTRYRVLSVSYDINAFINNMGPLFEAMSIIKLSSNCGRAKREVKALTCIRIMNVGLKKDGN